MEMLNQMLELVNNFLELAKILGDDNGFGGLGGPAIIPPLLLAYRRPESKEEKNNQTKD